MSDMSTVQQIDTLARTLEAEDALIHELIEEIETLENLLSPGSIDLVRALRPRIVTDNVYDDLDEDATLGERLADRIAKIAGSWGFIGTFILLMVIWIGTNLYMQSRAFDPYPFILLNLGLSTLAAMQAPVILMSQNRQASKDRAAAHNDYQVNLKSELEIAHLHRKIDELQRTIQNQQELIQRLVSLLTQDT